jgi:3-oxoacyl-[acyl-carrier protein] reductase
MKVLLQGKNAIVTGSARGMGKKIVETFAANGANVWACARKQTFEFEDYIKGLSNKYGVTVTPVYFELTDKVEMKSAVKQIMSAKLPVDILVNNAGITLTKMSQMTTIDDINNVLQVNFVAPYLFTQYIVKLMLRKKCGSIINICSTSAFDGNAGNSVYGASKSALFTATKCFAEEFGQNGIRVNAIAPGPTNTDMLDTLTEDAIKKLVDASCLKRVAETSDIANTALFLASDLSSYITGQVIRVDG